MASAKVLSSFILDAGAGLVITQHYVYSMFVCFMLSDLWVIRKTINQWDHSLMKTNQTVKRCKLY